MTWVNGIGPLPPTGPGAARSSVRGSGFAVPTGRPATAAGTAAAAETAGLTLGGMLALQEAESGSVRDREARRRGQDMLAELLRLQRALLAGEPDEAALHRLAALTADVPDAADPALRQAVAEVALRARVELARRQVITSG